MKKHRYLFVLTFVIFLILLVQMFVFAAQNKEENPIVLSLADTTGPTGLRGEGLKLLVEEIEKQTNGKVKVEVHWGGSLLSGGEILKGINDGIVDMGFVLANYYPKQMVVNSIFNVIPQGPIEFDNMHRVVSNIFEEIPAFMAELTELNQKLIYFNFVLSANIVSTKPFTSFDDFAGKKIRAASRWWLGALKGAGAIPVSVPWGNCYEALQMGTIDGVMSGYDGTHRAKLDEVAPNIFWMREIWTATPFMYTINLNTYNNLPKDIQEQLMAAGKSATLRFSVLFDEYKEKIMAEQKAAGYTVTVASEEDVERWVNMPVIPELQSEWLEEVKNLGIDDADVLLEQVKKIVTKGVEEEQGD